jgi:hypothetical protein
MRVMPEVLEETDQETIRALLESGLIAVFPKRGHVEVRGYGVCVEVPNAGGAVTAVSVVQEAVRIMRRRRGGMVPP